MTSLEFIEKEIKKTKELLQRLEKLKVISNKYELQLNEVLEKDTQEKLFYLQQIKSELEAWEVVKNKISIEKGSIDYATINIKDWHHHLTKEQFETLKKALEVKNEKEN